MNEQSSIKKQRSIKAIAFVLGITCWAFSAHAQPNLDAYVHEGLANNQSIKQQQFALQKSMYALREAKSLFLPSVSLNTTYTLAQGGRTVDIPIGDLLNGVYSTLNQLTQSSSFPQVENQSILLNPNNFYDAKFHVTWPLLNFEIEYNRRIKQNQVAFQQIEVDIYKRELVKEIKSAYFKYLQAAEAIKIYQSALTLVEENQRVNASLFKNDKVNRTAVIRSGNEVTKYQSLVEVARQNEESAKAYFNFLLNRDAREKILVDSTFQVPQSMLLPDTAVAQREELKKLVTAQAINEQVTGLSKSFIIPKVNTFIDLGSQGFDWEYNGKTRYYFFGVSMQWDLFSGGKNRHKIQQAETERKIIQSQTDYTERQLRLQLITTVNAYQAAWAQYQSAAAQQLSAEKYYADMLKLYKQGQVLFIELLDAQNQWVTAQLQTSISLFDTWTKWAEIERANASFALK